MEGLSWPWSRPVAWRYQRQAKPGPADHGVGAICALVRPVDMTKLKPGAALPRSRCRCRGGHPPM